MNFLKNISLLFLSSLLLFTSCRKDEELLGSYPPDSPIPEVLVNGSVYGLVKDEANQAIENALVVLGTRSLMTDENGYFAFRNVEINTKGSLVTVEKEGYFYNAKFVGSKLNRKNYVEIKLIQKSLVGSFAVNDGGTIVTNDGVAIRFGTADMTLR